MAIRQVWRAAVAALVWLLAGTAAVAQSAQEIGARNREAVRLVNVGDYAAALAYAAETLDAAESSLGADHPDTLSSVNNLAFLYRATGRYEEAEPLYERALTGRERVLGPEHPDTLMSVNNLAGLYYDTGRYAEAEPVYARALEAYERVLGPEHPDTLLSMNNLAALYEATGRFGEAEPLYARALEANERVLGSQHPDTLTSVNNLAALYEATGRYAEAERLYARALQARERVLGPEHPDTLMSVNNLGALYNTTGRYDEAQPLLERALKAYERVLGPEHPDTLLSVNNLAFLYKATGRYGEAEPLYARALKAYERVLGPEHPNTLTSVSNLASLYQAMGRFGEAEPLFVRTLEARERVLGPEHPETLTAVNNLGGLYSTTSRTAEAEALRRPGLERLAARLAREGDIGRDARAVDRTGAILVGEYYLSLVSILAVDAPAVSAPAALLAAQLGRQSAAGLAVEAAGARLAASDPAIGMRIRARDATVVQLASLEVQRTAAFVEGRSEDASRLTGEVDAARAEADGLTAAIAAEFPIYSDLIAFAPMTLAELQGAEGLRDGEALLAFIETTPSTALEPTWLVLVATRDSLRVLQLPAAPDAVAADVAAVRASLEFRDGAPPAFDLAAAHRLYDGLFAPLTELLAGVEHLIVVPDGPLQSLPLETLIATLPADAATGTEAYRQAVWLGDRFTISILPTISSLRALRRNAGASQGSRPVFAMADPALTGYTPAAADVELPLAFGDLFMGAVTDDFGDFRPEAVCDQALLPQTRAMGRAQVRALGGGDEDLVIGPGATEAAIYAANASGQLRDSRVIAFNTHGLTAGELRGYGDAEPALLMTPGWSCGTGALPKRIDPADDGLLTASEITGLDLDADWVLLTACNTAAGDGTLGAEPLSGLARAFFYAGARSLLVSHWPAEANATELLIAELFSPDAEGLAKAQSLQRAQAIVRADPRYAHPAYWAAFEIVGAGQ